MDVKELTEKIDFGAALDFHLFNMAGTQITVATLIMFALIVLVTFFASWLVQRALVRLFRARGVTDVGTIGVARRLTHYVIVAIGLGVGLQTIGVNLAALFAAGAVLAVGIGFAMQNIVQNFVSGVILLMERSIKPGDILEVEGRFVRVTRMGIRVTQARTLDDEEIIVPNATIVQSTVKNYTLQDSHYRLRCTVGVVYGADMRQVRTVLERAAHEIDGRIPEQEPVILLTGFGDSSVDWEISVWINDPWSMNRRRSQLYEAIWFALLDAGITIAFPQLDVHFDTPVVDALTARKAS